MPKDTDEIVVGQNGTVYVAPVGTTAPADIATAWGVGWVDLGYLTEDGVTAADSRTTERLNVWQMFYAARYIVTERDFRLSFVLRQWSKTTVPFALGGGTVTTTAGPPAHYRYDPPDPEDIDERALGVEWADGSKIYRLIVPRGMPMEGVETNLTRTNAADLPITFGLMGTDGAFPFYLRTNDPAFA